VSLSHDPVSNAVGNSNDSLSQAI